MNFAKKCIKKSRSAGALRLTFISFLLTEVRLWRRW